MRNDNYSQYSVLYFIHIDIGYQCIVFSCTVEIYLLLVLTLTVEHGSSAVENQTCNQVSPGSNPPFLLFRRLGIFVFSIDAPVVSAV